MRVCGKFHEGEGERTARAAKCHGHVKFDGGHFANLGGNLVAGGRWTIQ